MPNDLPLDVTLDAVSLRVIMDALPRAVIVTDPGGAVMCWNRAAEELYGWTEAEVLGRPVRDVVTVLDDATAVADIRERVLAGTSWSGDFTVKGRDDRVIRIFASNRPVQHEGRTIGIVSMAEDVSQQRQIEEENAALADQLRVALDVGGLGTWRWDRASGSTEWDPKLAALYGLPPGVLRGSLDSWYAALHPEDRQHVVDALEGAVEAKGSYQVEHRVVWRDGTIRWLQGKGQMVLDDHGEVVGAIGCSSEVTEQVELSLERERVARAATDAAETERVARERMEFLTEINDALGAAGSRREAMRNVTRAAVPRLGDLCAIYVLPDNGSPYPDLEVAHADESVAIDPGRLSPYDPASSAMVPTIIRTGESQIFRTLDEDAIAGSPTPDESRAVIEALSLHSIIGAALVKRDRVLGAIQFVNSGSSRSYTDDDVVLAEIVASRIASALDNLRLREHEQMIASTLQASLLPASLPDIPGVRLAVRYWAAGEASEVGGDFYDAFEVDGGWAVVIGDVCGTGPTAAATTGLARHTIRASAWHGADPDDVVVELNRAMLRAGGTTFCTVAYTRLTPDADGWRLEAVSGGHPLPLVCRRDGAVEPVARPGTLVGMLDEVRTDTVTTRLTAGDTVVFYTDGVTDVRPPHDLSPERFEEMVRESCLGAASADAVADGLHRRIESVLPLSERNDDIALFVLRVDDPSGQST